VAVGFFPWHVAVYRNRPIFWLLSSEGFEQGRTRLTFRVYVHFLKLTADTLHRVLTYHLAPMISSAEREWALARDEAVRQEGKARTATRARADEWGNTVSALKNYRGALEGVIQGPPQAERVPDRARWLPRMIAFVQGGQDIGHGYRPNVDLGIRVNIAPLAKRRLLPRSVLTRLGR
jgi:hypothetical protein